MSDPVVKGRTAKPMVVYKEIYAAFLNQVNAHLGVVKLQKVSQRETISVIVPLLKD
jgi:hypothetical protein